MKLIWKLSKKIFSAKLRVSLNLPALTQVVVRIVMAASRKNVASSRCMANA